MGTCVRVSPAWVNLRLLLSALLSLSYLNVSQITAFRYSQSNSLLGVPLAVHAHTCRAAEVEQSLRDEMVTMAAAHADELKEAVAGGCCLLRAKILCSRDVGIWILLDWQRGSSEHKS